MLDKTVFAFGSGRSGTTLLAKLIDSSRSVLYRHEPDKTIPNNHIPFLPEPEQYEKFLGESRLYIEELTEQRDPFVSGKQPIFDKDFRTPIRTAFLRTFLPVFIGAGKFGLHLRVPDLLKTNRYRFLIKSVNSVCRVPMFARSVPGMKFVHIVRHPGAIIASQLRGIEQDKMGRELFLDAVSRMSNTSRFPITHEEISAAGFAEQFAYTWMVQNDKSQQEMEGNPDYLLISYEDLCVNMRERMSGLCDFLGIEFDSQMKAFIDAIHDTDNDSGYFSVMKNPLANIDKWERVLNDGTAEKIARIIEHSDVGRFALSRYVSARQQISG